MFLHRYVILIVLPPALFTVFLIVVEGIRKLSLKLGKSGNSDILLILALINPTCVRFGGFMLIKLG